MCCNGDGFFKRNQNKRGSHPLAPYNHRVHAEWQRPLSGVHSIMMEKNQTSLVIVGGALPPPFTLSTITCKVVVYTPPERADAVPLPLFILYPYMYSVPLTLQLDKQ